MLTFLFVSVFLSVFRASARLTLNAYLIGMIALSIGITNPITRAYIIASSYGNAFG